MTKTLIIDGQEIEVDENLTLLQACEEAGAEIPRFCYHERLSIAGNCRMCLVEVVGGPKPVASCAMTVKDLPPNRDGTPKQINTKTPPVKKAREGVMEFLLINHPLDCPICDQGGECDLQDQAMAYGVGGTRFDENKRAVEDKYLGPLIKTSMTRCIHCTRCVRFMTEVAGVEELGLIGRGEDAEITTYLENGMLSEMSANVNDLCPVGALTHRPWAHNVRPWELKKTQSIDVMDAMGSAIRVDTRGREVMRILPRNNDAINEEWISDKTRHVADGLRTQRLDQPYVRRAGKLEPASWDDALMLVGEKMKDANPARIGAIAGDLAGVEEMFALKTLLDELGSKNMDCRQDGVALTLDAGRAGYTFANSLASIDEADAILLIGTNPRLEAPVMNMRIRRGWRDRDIDVGLIGAPVDVAYDYDHLGEGASALGDVASGKHPFAKTLRNAKAPLVIVGMGALTGKDGAGVLAKAVAIGEAASSNTAEGWQTFNVLHTAASRVGGLDVGFVPGEGGMATHEMLSKPMDVLYLLGADDCAIGEVPAETFVVYQGHHGDAGAHRADVILPGAAYTEKSAIYVNTEGRAQMTARAAFPPGQGKEDWTILRALSAYTGRVLPFDTLDALRQKLFKAVPKLMQLDVVPDVDASELSKLADASANVSETTFGQAVTDFYLTNAIARASVIMAEMSALKNAKTQQALHAAE
ncbi:MAG: NADH-quinone oxidoreductase subunit NuoG [Hyphomicrobiaceae bacterium]